MEQLSKKQSEIFDYIKKVLDSRGVAPSVREIGEAVGLRSTSTVQYHLNALEELGYIVQPHTSAGRIPTDKAYRLYVDTMMEEKDREINNLKDMLVEAEEKMDMMLKNVAKVANDQLAITLRYTPKLKEFILEKGYDKKFGARPMRRAIQSYIEDEISDAVLKGEASCEVLPPIKEEVVKPVRTTLTNLEYDAKYLQDGQAKNFERSNIEYSGVTDFFKY